MPAYALMMIIADNDTDRVAELTMVVDPLSTTGLAIAIIDESVNVVLFVDNWIKTAKHYGDDIRIIRQQVATEFA